MDYFVEKLKFQVNFIMHKADLSRLNTSGKKPQGGTLGLFFRHRQRSILLFLPPKTVTAEGNRNASFLTFLCPLLLFLIKDGEIKREKHNQMEAVSLKGWLNCQ